MTMHLLPAQSCSNINSQVISSSHVTSQRALDLVNEKYLVGNT